MAICLPEAAEYLVSHPLIRHVTFIGSQAVGRLVSQAASRNIIPCTMELGGNDAAIILDCCKDVETVSDIIMRGCFQVIEVVAVRKLMKSVVMWPKLHRN
jgi:acyl-CoA reductase-like NAD-dependent aldehyde dehydrogenase